MKQKSYFKGTNRLANSHDSAAGVKIFYLLLRPCNKTPDLMVLGAQNSENYVTFALLNQNGKLTGNARAT